MKKLLFTIIVALQCISAYAGFLPIYGREVVITNSVNDDLYISGGTVRIEAPVHGDVLICGGTVIISNTVTGSIFVLGGELIFSGWVDGSLRCASGKATISGVINRDLVVVSGDVICDKKTIINGGVLATGGNLKINGTVNRNVQSYAANTQIEGVIKEDVNCKGDRIYINGTVGGKATLSANDIEIDDSAAFQGDVRYWDSDGTVDFKQSMFGKQPVLDPTLEIVRKKWHLLGFTAAVYVIWYLLSALVIIILAQYLFKKIMNRSSRIKSQPVKSMAYGLAFIILVPITIILCFISLIGIPVGMLLITGLGILTIFNSAILSVFLANVINSRNQYNWSDRRLAGVAFLMFIMVKILSLVPVIGWIVILLATAVMFGMIIRTASEGRTIKTHAVK